MTTRPPRRTARRPAFTLVELLVVIFIIVVLAGLALAVGGRVRDSGRARLTEQVLNVLDLALNAYVSERGAQPPPYVIIDGTAWPMADARNMGYVVPRVDESTPANEWMAPSTQGPAMLNSVGYFAVEASTVSSAAAALAQLDARVFRQIDIDASASGDAGPQPSLPTALDAWGRPIRFVHGAFQREILGDRGDATASITRASNPDAFSRLGLPESLARATWGTDALRRNAQYTDEGGDAESFTIDGVIADLVRANARNVPDSDGASVVGRTPYFYSLGPDGRVGRYIGSETAPSSNPTSMPLRDFNSDNLYTKEPILPAS